MTHVRTLFSAICGRDIMSDMQKGFFHACSSDSSNYFVQYVGTYVVSSVLRNI